MRIVGFARLKPVNPSSDAVTAGPSCGMIARIADMDNAAEFIAMKGPVAYVHLAPEDHLPPSAVTTPAWFVVIVESKVTTTWRDEVSAWMVKSGCLYMMAWGIDCSAWDDSVDLANLKSFEFGDIPDDKFVMTTWHDKETLSEVFWFAKHTAIHPDVELKRTVLLHISSEPRERDMFFAFGTS